MKDNISEINASKESYIDQYLVEVEVGVTPERPQLLPDNVQAKREQFGLKHFALSAIHEAMKDKIPSVDIEIPLNNINTAMWNKGQMIVIKIRA